MKKACFCFVVALAIPPSAGASTFLGSALSFAVLGGSTVTNTGPTNIVGNVGVWPGTSDVAITHNADEVAHQAQIDAANASVALGDLASSGDLSGQDLGTIGMFTPGVYVFSSDAELTGLLTLDALHDPNALFVFRIAASLTTAPGALVHVVNGGANTQLYWTVGSSATLGTGTVFAGNIIAGQSVTLTSSAEIVCGRAIALNGAVTMDSNSISNDCIAGGNFGSGRSDFGSAGFGGTALASSEVFEPGTFSLVFAVLTSCIFMAHKRKFRKSSLSH
jgi:type VI secretion system secreted protein VgrG